jgi:hypothetical protein
MLLGGWVRISTGLQGAPDGMGSSPDIAAPGGGCGRDGTFRVCSREHFRLT